MYSQLKELKEFLSNKSNFFGNSNHKLIEVVQKYEYLYISKKDDYQNNNNISENIKNSPILIINCYTDTYFIIGFKKTIILVDQSQLSFVKWALLINKEIEIFFLPKTKVIFNQNINIDIKEPSTYYNETFFTEEQKNFKQQIFLKKTFSIWEFIFPCISGYLIKQSYLKLNYDRINDFKISKQNIKIFKENEFIELRTIGGGLNSKLKLIYHFDDENLYLIKSIYSSESLKLIEREKTNYNIINYPLFPKLYGGIKYEKKCQEFLVIEFINGQTLSNIDNLNLTLEDKLLIIFQLLLVFQYLYINNFVYRDLKPDNVMIDQNKTAILIDFDRMITNNNNNSKYTNDLQSEFLDPDVNEGKISHANDIYSLGRFIKYALKANPEIFDNNPGFYFICDQCIDADSSERPLIFDLIVNFYSIFFKYFPENPIFKKNQETQFLYDIFKYKSNLNEIDLIKMSLFYAYFSNQDDSEAQYQIGNFFINGKYIKQDIDKAIHHLSISAKKYNNLNAISSLLGIYCGSKYNKKDSNKFNEYLKLVNISTYPKEQSNSTFIYSSIKYKNSVIQFYSKISDQNDPNIHYKLGKMYYNGLYIEKNIQKSIYFFQLAARKNHLKAIIGLASIYFKVSDFIDIHKSIQYMSCAAELNDLKMQNFLASIYYKGEYVPRDIEKAIYYYKLAANQNDSDAQYMLGKIYLKDKYIKQDIEKANYYLKLAADQNNSDAQHYLNDSYGEVFFSKAYLLFYEIKENKENKYSNVDANENYYVSTEIRKLLNIKRSTKTIDKVIHYFKLAANQNYPDAHYYLGKIFYKGKYIERDIKKAIKHFYLAANQNEPLAQYYLGIIFYEGKYIERDINKAINYFKLASNQGDPRAQYYLGEIFYQGKYIERDINKAINYFKLASNQGDPRAQYYLGEIFYQGKYIERDINKAIHYLTLSAKRNCNDAQFLLGVLYLFIKKNIKNAEHYLIQSTSNGDELNNFVVGYFYHEGKFFRKNIEKSIKYYKKSSSQDFFYAKNNLGIIYKNLIDVPKHIGIAIGYFEESSIKLKDKVSMYNLSHIYIYEDQTNDRIDKAINYLITSLQQNFEISKDLLCIALIKKHKFDFDKICADLYEKIDKNNDLPNAILQYIKQINLLNESIFNEFYSYYKTINFLYDYKLDIIETKTIMKENKMKDISSSFYEGFGIPI